MLVYSASSLAFDVGIASLQKRKPQSWVPSFKLRLFGRMGEGGNDELTGNGDSCGNGRTAEEARRPEVRNSQKRLMITDMVLENFKSYAGAQRVGPFHKCFSSVVGPNGSGKSNVIDAMLFVFGKRAKQLRLNKVSELIHNSTNHQNLSEARVSVYFQEIIDLDDERYEVVPNSEIIVARSAYSNNTSKYFIGDKTSNFTEVTTLLKKKGIDLDNNRFLILQGEVEQIAMMKPKSQGPHDEGLLEYLEDIIGSNCHVQQIEEQSKLLEDLNEKRVSMVQRVKLVEKDKETLEGAKKEAEAYMMKEAEKLQWQGRVYELSLREAGARLESMEKQISEVDGKLNEEREKCADYKKVLAEMEAKYNQSSNEHNAIKAELDACHSEFSEYERKDVKYREDLKHSKGKQKKLEGKIAQDTAKLEDSKKEVEESRAVLPELESTLANLTEELGGEEKQLEMVQESIKGEVEGYQQKLSKVRVELEPYEKQLNNGRALVDVAKSERDLLSEKHEAAGRHFTEAQQTMKEQEASIARKEQELKAMAAAVDKYKLAAVESREKEEACMAEESTLEGIVQTARARAADLKEALRSEKTQNSMMQFLMKAKQSGSIPGIFGRLGDLGAIDAKYDIAISTACGALDYVVVENTAAAQACIELLRANNLGVATFLILDKQQGLVSAMKEQIQTPEGVPRLFDLVKTKDDRLLPAFYFALRNTVVAKDIDQGTRISYGSDRRFRRVVTLEGTLFESSGTMAGGGGKPRGGKMGTSVCGSGASKEDLVQAEQELASLTQQLQLLRDRRTQAVQGLEKANKALAELELKIPKVEMEVEALRTQHEELGLRLADLERDAQPNEGELARIEELSEIIAAGEQTLAKIQSSCAHLRQKVEALQKQIDDAGAGKLKQQKAKIGSLLQEIDTTSSEINRRRVLISSNEKAIKKLQKSIGDSQTEYEKQKNAHDATLAERKEIEKGAFDVHQNYERVKGILDTKKTELEAIQEEYSQLKSTVSQLVAGEVDAQCKLDDLKRLAKGWQEKTKHFTAALSDVHKEQKKHLAQLEADGVDPREFQNVLAAVDIEASKEECLQQVADREAQLKEMKPNMAAIAEYRKKEAEYGERVKDLDGVTGERDNVRHRHEELRKRRLNEFIAGFNVITMKLKEMYQMITQGGDAELELVDSLDPFSEGIVFSVRPPKKSWKNIANLSGGEKTLSSLALVFALHHYKPTPLYVMDEIDAALDFKNVSIVAHYIKDRTKNAQFIIISLRNNMFELADRLVGIYKTDNCTKSITINPRSFTVSAAS